MSEKKELASNKLDEVADVIYQAKQAFFRSTLVGLVAFKVFLGRCLSGSEYGDGAVEYLAEKTGISASVLYDAQKMYREEKLTMKTEVKFIENFPTSYSSWKDYKYNVLYPKTLPEKVLQNKCRNCPIHCIDK